MPIKSYSTTASSNNASPPNGFPEGMAPASLNDGMRQVMADIRAWYESPTYIDLGDTPTYVNTTTFTLSGDKTATYLVGARIKASGTTPFTVYGTIATSSFSSPNTTIAITWDSSAMDSTLNAVAIVNIPDDAIVSGKIRSLAASKITGTLPLANGGTGLTALEATVASASTVDLGAQVAPTVNVTGTTTITSFGTVASGTFRRVVFSGILTLTHNGTSLILPSGANITTAAGDSLEAVSLGSGNWRVISYQKSNGEALSSPSVSVISSTVATTSGTTQDIAVSGVKQFTVNLSAVSLNATSQPCILLSAGATFETSGYASGISSVGASVGTIIVTTSIPITTAGLPASSSLQGGVTFTLVDASTNTWSYFGIITDTGTSYQFICSGSKSLAGAIDEVRLTTVAGTATFDAGKINLVGMY